MKSGFTILLLFLWLGTGAVAGPVESNDVRVWAFYTNCFEYVFTSVIGVTEGKPTLGFNHLDGSTVFVREGGVVGDRILSGFTSRVERGFDASLNAWQNRRGGVVRLSQTGEADVVLEMGKPLAMPGYLALLVKLSTGAAGYVRVGDSVEWAGERATVSAVEPGVVTIRDSSGTMALGFPSDAERSGLMAQWEARRQEEVQRRLDAIEATEAAQLQAAQLQAASEAQVVRAAPRRKLVQLTFNPLRIVEAIPYEQVVAYVVGPSGKPGEAISVTPITLKVPMPRFRTMEYRGTVLTYSP